MQNTRVRVTGPATIRANLDPFFKPSAVAVVGATDKAGKVGQTVMSNLMANFRGRLYPVNPNQDQVGGLRAYPNLGALPEPVDMAVIVTPALTVPGIISECSESRVPAALIISAGFKEIGRKGLELEHQVLE
ncbi:MAG: CoA-binding protein, partial [Bryobacteraceae bacterium]